MSSIVNDMYGRIFNKLEDPKNLLLGPNIKSLKFWGILLPDSKLKKNFLYLLHFFMMLFVVTQYIDVWLVRSDIKTLLNNLKTSIVSPVNVFKVTTLYIWQQRWSNILDYISRAERRQKMNKKPKNTEIIANNTKYCRIVTYIYWSLTYFTAFSIIIQPITKCTFSKTYRWNIKNGTDTYPEIIRSWVPFDKTKITGYLIASIFQIYGAVYVSGYISSFDTIVIVIMMFFKTELMVLKNDSSDIFGSVLLPAEHKNAKRKIMECHRRHVELVKYAEIFNSCLSSVMCLYVFVCSLMLCAAIYQITIEINTMNRFLTVEYLTFGVAQLFMYCWHSNEVMVASQNLLSGPYESLWWNHGTQRKTDMRILIEQFRKTIVFSAGPFTDLTIATFINILKGAYSYYTLINKDYLVLH